MDDKSRDMDQGAEDKSYRNKTFKRLCVRFAEKTSMQGVPYINNAKLLGAKIAWTILLLLAMAAMGLHLWYLIDQFNNFPYTAKVSFGFGNLRLPEITICNTNPIHSGRLDEFDGADELKRLIEDMRPEVLAPEQFDDDLFFSTYADYYYFQDGQYNYNRSALDGVVEEDEDEYSGFDPRSYDSEFDNWWNEDGLEFDDDEYDGAIDTQARLQEVFESLYMDLPADDRADLGHQIDDMLLTCSFNGRVCNSSMFRLFQSPRYGNCWTLSNDRFTVQEPGPSGALSLTLFLESTRYLTGVTQGYGLQVEIHEPGSYPDPFESGFLVPASMETSLGLRMIKIERIGKPHSNCEPGGSFIALYNKTYTRKIKIERIGKPHSNCEPGGSFRALYNKTYTRKSCRLFCQATTAMQTCGCFDEDWYELIQATGTTLQPCETDAQWDCLTNIQRQFDKKTISCSCLNPCTEITYNKEISSRQWPNSGFSRILLKQVCDRDFDECQQVRNDSGTEYQIMNNFVKLNVFYEDLNFEQIKEEADIENAQFLSDVGGAVGLWIGLSILSLCEVVQLIIEIIDLAAYRCCRAGRHKERHSDRSSRQRENNDFDGPYSDRNGRGPYPREEPYSHMRENKYLYDYPSQYNDDRPSSRYVRPSDIRPYDDPYRRDRRH